MNGCPEIWKFNKWIKTILYWLNHFSICQFSHHPSTFFQILFPCMRFYFYILAPILFLSGTFQINHSFQGEKKGCLNNELRKFPTSLSSHQWSLTLIAAMHSWWSVFLTQPSSGKSLDCCWKKHSLFSLRHFSCSSLDTVHHLTEEDAKHRAMKRMKRVQIMLMCLNKNW